MRIAREYMRIVISVDAWEDAGPGICELIRYGLAMQEIVSLQKL